MPPQLLLSIRHVATKGACSSYTAIRLALFLLHLGAPHPRPLPTTRYARGGRGGRRHIALRHIFTDVARRRPRPMRGGFAAGAAVPGIIRRRLQSGARAHAGIAAVDRGIEQFGQRRPDRLHVGAVCFGFGSLAGFFPGVGFLGHGRNMGPRRRWEKSQYRFGSSCHGTALAGRSRFNASGKCCSTQPLMAA
jgi:hypothetical protein